MKIIKTVENNKTRIDIKRSSSDLDSFRQAVDTIRTKYSDTSMPLTLDETAKLICSYNKNGKSLQLCLQGKQSVSYSEYVTAMLLSDSI